VTTIVYGVGDMICTIGFSTLEEGGPSLPFIGFVKRSVVPEECFTTTPTDDRAVQMIEIINANDGVLVYFDNLESAERFHTLAAAVFTMACRTDWADRKQASETIN
jgi:hypothetical protein